MRSFRRDPTTLVPAGVTCTSTARPSVDRPAVRGPRGQAVPLDPGASHRCSPMKHGVRPGRSRADLPRRSLVEKQQRLVQRLLDEILAIVLDPEVDDERVGPLLREGVGLDRMRAARATRQERLPRDHGQLAMLTAVRLAGGVGFRDDPHRVHLADLVSG